ncbi:hypothetical protein [Sorangium sp. So ce381]
MSVIAIATARGEGSYAFSSADGRPVRRDAQQFHRIRRPCARVAAA